MPQNEHDQESQDVQPLQPKGVQPNFEELEFLYANNVRYESSVWDFKMIFGQLNMVSGAEVVDFHTAMTIPWQVAKLMIYFLKLNVAIHELESGGKLRINPRVLPVEPPPLAPEFENNELHKKSREIALKIHAEFIAEQG